MPSVSEENTLGTSVVGEVQTADPPILMDASLLVPSFVSVFPLFLFIERFITFCLGYVSLVTKAESLGIGELRCDD